MEANKNNLELLKQVEGILKDPANKIFDITEVAFNKDSIWITATFSYEFVKEMILREYENVTKNVGYSTITYKKDNVYFTSYRNI